MARPVLLVTHRLPPGCRSTRGLNFDALLTRFDLVMLSSTVNVMAAFSVGYDNIYIASAVLQFAMRLTF